MRDNMNYDEYDWGFDASKAPSDENSKAINPWTIPALECYGPACCINGQNIYDPKQNKCVPISSCNNTSTNTNMNSPSSFSLLDSLTNSLRTESFRNGGNNYLPTLGYSYIN
jgi:hypothetical protein